MVTYEKILAYLDASGISHYETMDNAIVISCSSPLLNKGGVYDCFAKIEETNPYKQEAKIFIGIWGSKFKKEKTQALKGFAKLANEAHYFGSDDRNFSIIEYEDYARPCSEAWYWNDEDITPEMVSQLVLMWANLLEDFEMGYMRFPLTAAQYDHPEVDDSNEAVLAHVHEYLYKEPPKSSNNYNRTATAQRTNDDDDDADDDGCFITTAVCSSLAKGDNCCELNMFRNFRDSWLKKQSDGESLIKEYYQIAPKIVKNIEKQTNAKKIYAGIWENYLMECLRLLKEEKYIKCKRLYIVMVQNLKRQYL